MTNRIQIQTAELRLVTQTKRATSTDYTEIFGSFSLPRLAGFSHTLKIGTGPFPIISMIRIYTDSD